MEGQIYEFQSVHDTSVGLFFVVELLLFQANELDREILFVSVGDVYIVAICKTCRN